MVGLEPIVGLAGVITRGQGKHWNGRTCTSEMLGSATISTAPLASIINLFGTIPPPSTNPAQARPSTSLARPGTTQQGSAQRVLQPQTVNTSYRCGRQFEVRNIPEPIIDIQRGYLVH